MCGPEMRWCGLILNGAGSLAQASQIAWKGVRHRSALRCLAKSSAVTNTRTWAEKAVHGLELKDLYGDLLDRAVRYSLDAVMGPRRSARST